MPDWHREVDPRALSARFDDRPGRIFGVRVYSYCQARAGNHRGRHAIRIPIAIRIFTVLLALIGLWPALVAPAWAAGDSPAPGAVRVDSVEAELVADRTAVVPGTPMRIGVRLRHDPHWHTYWRNPGDSGLPTRVDLDLPEGFVAGAIRWPAPQRLFIPPLANYGYEGEIVLPMALDVPSSLPGGDVHFAAHVSWLMCRDICIPGEARLALVLPVQRGGVAPESRFAGLFEVAEAGMPRGTTEVAVRADGEVMSIALNGQAASAEFFPYEEGFIDNAADQVLHAGGTAGDGRVLQVRLSEDGVRQLAADDDRVLAAAAGVLVIDGVASEAGPRLAAQVLPIGTEIWRARGVSAQPGGEGIEDERGQGWLDGSGSRWRADMPSGASSAQPPLFGQASGAAATGVAGAIDSGREAGSAGRALARNFASATLWLAVVSGLVGGLILNLMPCVFPVIGLKVLDFTRNADRADAGSRLAALSFAGGVLVSFWALAGLLLLLRAGGEAAGWGFQLQSPVFVAAMALLFVAIALNFSGVYEIGLAMTRLGGVGLPSGAGNGSAAPPARLSGSFATGVLAVLVATPCTAPFMGSALGFTLASSGRDAMIVFTAIAVGMAAPYVLLGFFPQALRILPPPGRWMESFRQFLAFPMYATAAWLAWVLGQQVGIDAVFALAAGAVLLGFAAWLYGRFIQHAPPARGSSDASRARQRILAGALAAASVAAGVWVAWPAAGPVLPSSSAQVARADARIDGGGWLPWSENAVRQARDAGRPVFVEYTAAWCVSCQVNKRLVLDRESIVARMNELGVARFRADWTNRDPDITGSLAGFGRNGVPLYLLYRPGAPVPEILPEILTPGIVRDALAGAAS